MKQSNLKSIRSALASGGAVLAIASSAAYAQQQPAQQEASGLETVVVSSTRITAAGFDAPTPTTVVGADLIANVNKDDLFSVVNDMPSMMGSNTQQTGLFGTSQATNGLESFNLFGLGSDATLTLLDGQRFVAAVFGGTPDVQEFPQVLIERVDVVTGGASASWGSDAIGGVVNFVTNKNFNGVKADLTGGISTYSDNATLKGDFAYGTPFLGDRAHFEMAVEYTHLDGVQGNLDYNGTLPGGRNFYHGQKEAEYASPSATPAGYPQYFDQYNLTPNTLSEYGLINSGPLMGTAFNAAGQPYQFAYGTGPNGLPCTPAKNGSATGAGTVTNAIAGFCFGGNDSGDLAGADTLAAAQTRGDIYLRQSYNLNADNTVYMTVNAAEVGTQAISFPSMPFNALPGEGANAFGQQVQLPGIQCGNGPSAAALPAGDLPGPNAFLPASINAACIANSVTSFSYGDYTDNVFAPSWVRTDRTNIRFAVGADGDFNLLGNDWTYSTYATHGETRAEDKIGPIVLEPYFYAALDAVATTTADDPSVPAGTIVCRNASARAEGCVPLNLFGGQANPAAVSWALGNGVQPFQLQHIIQDAASFSVNSTPFSTWAGKVALASGIEYRQEMFNVKADGYGSGTVPGSNGAAGGVCSDPLLNCVNGANWYGGNFANGQGTYHVSEGFVEFGVPLLDSPSYGKLVADLADRYEFYSTAGDFDTWKVGLTYDTPLPGLRFRSLLSRDVRAPTLADLYSPTEVRAANFINPFTDANINIHASTQGNPNLKPERSTDWQYGAVYQPEWFPGFRVSADYNRVYVADVIGSVSGQTAINNCFAGLTSYCSAITVSGGGNPATNSNWINIATAPYNLNKSIVEVFNYEADYKTDLDYFDLPGSLSLRALATNLQETIAYSGLTGVYSYNGSGNNDGSSPHWQGTFYQTYDAGNYSVTLTEKYISAGLHDTSATQCAIGSCPVATLQFPTILDNEVPAIYYINLGAKYYFTDTLQGYVQIDNLMDKMPPLYGYTSYIVHDGGSNPGLYDAIGRMFHVGIRFAT